MAEEIGAMEAAVEGIKAVAPGLSLSKILSEIGSELGRMGVQGSAEMAAALFSDSNAYVPYGRGQNPVETNIEAAEVKKRRTASRPWTVTTGEG